MVNTYTSGSQIRPSVISLNDGGFIVTWESDGQDGSGIGIFGQKFDSTGTMVGVEFQVNTYTNERQWSMAKTLKITLVCDPVTLIYLFILIEICFPTSESIGERTAPTDNPKIQRNKSFLR